MCNTRKVNKFKLFILILLIASYYFLNIGGISANAQNSEDVMYSDVRIDDDFDDDIVTLLKRKSNMYSF